MPLLEQVALIMGLVSQPVQTQNLINRICPSPSLEKHAVFLFCSTTSYQHNRFANHFKYLSKNAIVRVIAKLNDWDRL
jgi:hypothetical protein